MLSLRTLTRSALAFALALPLAHAAPAPKVKAPQVEAPGRVLFVGNSYLYYNDSLHNHVRRMAIAADPTLEKKTEYKSATIGGATLAHHDVEHLTQPGRIGVKQPFELVILQGNSASAMSDKRRAEFREAVIAHDRIIRERGGRTALYLTHAYVAPHKQTKPEMLERTADMYISTANEVDALVIPVGLAFEEAYRRRPDLQLHKHYDGSHPSLLGTYLAAATVYASIYGKSPVGNSYDYYGAIDKDTARFLQQVAHDTVQKFYGR